MKITIQLFREFPAVQGPLKNLEKPLLFLQFPTKRLKITFQGLFLAGLKPRAAPDRGFQREGVTAGFQISRPGNRGEAADKWFGLVLKTAEGFKPAGFAPVVFHEGAETGRAAPEPESWPGDVILPGGVFDQSFIVQPIGMVHIQIDPQGMEVAGVEEDLHGSAAALTAETALIPEEIWFQVFNQKTRLLYNL
jgi:hypothetical protein